MPEACWAYDFTCSLSLDGIIDAFNAAGPWQWNGVDSDRYGDYLVSRPERSLELRLHEYPGIGLVQFKGLIQFKGLRWRGYKAQLEIRPESTTTRPEVEAIFRRLLELIRAKNVTEVEPFF